MENRRRTIAISTRPAGLRSKLRAPGGRRSSRFHRPALVMLCLALASIVIGLLAPAASAEPSATAFAAHPQIRLAGVDRLPKWQRIAAWLHIALYVGQMQGGVQHAVLWVEAKDGDFALDSLQADVVVAANMPGFQPVMLLSLDDMHVFVASLPATMSPAGRPSR